MFPFCACNTLILLRSIFGLSLHHGLAWGWRGGWVEVGDADGAKGRCGALCCGGDGAFCRAIAEIDIDDPDGFENRQGFGGGEIEARGFELLLDGTMDEEGERGDKAHRIDGGQIGLFGLDDVFALIGLLARKVDRMLEEAKLAVLVGPAVIAVAMIAPDNAGGGRADLLRRLEPSLGNALLQLFEPGPHPFHGLDAVPALESRG